MQALFHGALDLPEAERSPFLKTSCTDDQSLMDEVLAMLEEDSSTTSLLNRDIAQVAKQVLGDGAHAAFREFGPYRIKSVLGEGGMGVVYLAEREDLGIQVAIKILRDAWLSPARRERFASEQRTLAQLNHPSIARLYDADTWPDGTPWFVMEYVDGLRLTDYCSQHKCSIEELIQLFREVCGAVQYAHQHSVIHRDLKPSNILVKSDGSVRLLDFGIAKHIDTMVKPVDRTGTGVRLMTPAYAAPEQIRGESAGIHTDVYSLGVILYELLSGRLPFDVSQMTPSEMAATITTATPAKPSSVARSTGTRTASWNDLDVLCLTAMHKDPKRRYQSVEAFVRDLDHYLKHEPLEARPDSLRYTAGMFVRRNWQAVCAASAMIALLIVVIALTLSLSGKGRLSGQDAKSVAVLPFQNTGNDHSVDFLRVALANDISSTLGYARSLSIRPSEATSKYVASNLDLQKAGRELRVNRLVTGQFLIAGEQLQITLEVIDVESNRPLWREVFDVPARNMIAMQAQVAAKTRRALAPVLGVSEFVTDNPPKPTNEEAYNLFLQAKALSTNPEPTRQAIEMLERSVAIDPGYAPAWEALSSKYLNDNWFGNGGEAAWQRWRASFERAVALDPDNIIFRADNLYYAGMVGRRTESGGMPRSEAYRGLEDLVRRRPDNARLHFLLSWTLRDVGLLEESARECETSVLVDALDAGARSCGVTFMFLGDYRRALDYLHLDPGSVFEKTISIDVRLRQGKDKEALEALRDSVPPWGGYDMLLAYLEHKPAADVAALARTVQAASDAEVNYFSAAHLAYCGQSEAALRILKETIQGGYCSYPAIDSDPLFASLRGKREFAEIRSAAIACRNDFVAQRGQAPR